MESKKEKFQGCTFVSILQLGIQRGVWVNQWGHAQCSTKIDDGPINMAPLKL